MRLFFVAPDYYEDRPKACMNGWGSGVPDRRARRHRAALPHRAHAAGPDLPERARASVCARSGSTREGFNRYRGTDWMKEPCRSCEQGGRPRRLPLPGVSDRRRSRGGGSGVPLQPASRQGARGSGAGGGGGLGQRGAPAGLPRSGQFAPAGRAGRLATGTAMPGSGRQKRVSSGLARYHQTRHTTFDPNPVRNGERQIKPRQPARKQSLRRWFLCAPRGQDHLQSSASAKQGSSGSTRGIDSCNNELMRTDRRGVRQCDAGARGARQRTRGATKCERYIKHILA